MKKGLLFITAVFAFATTLLAQAPTTFWTDNTNTQWYNTQDTEFVLSTSSELAGLSELVAAGNDFSGITISINADLDLGAHVWKPIGVDGNNPFSGIFNGNNHVISNLYVNMIGVEMAGLFGRVIEGELKNVTLENPTVKGGDSSGSLVGNVWRNGVIKNCHAIEVVVESDGANVGGLIGDMVDNGSISRCSSQGVVMGSDNVGGLLGSPHNGVSISESFSIGSVNANHLAGGLIGASVIGFPGTLENTVENCYSRANVTVVNGHVGGLVGHATALISITSSYSTGTATGPEFDGGFVGAGGDFGTLNNYWNTEASGHTDGVGGWQGTPGTPDITAKTTVEMKTAEMADLLNNGNVNGPWKINPAINGGYPNFDEGSLSLTSNDELNVSLKVYPNVFDASLNIDADTQLINYVIYTTSGRIIREGKLDGKSTTLSTTSINAGMYILIVNTAKGKISKKIIKH